MFINEDTLIYDSLIVDSLTYDSLTVDSLTSKSLTEDSLTNNSFLPSLQEVTSLFIHYEFAKRIHVKLI